MDKAWEISPRKYDDVILQLLYSRGVISRSNQDKMIDQFFNPDFEHDLYDPMLLPDCKKAIERISFAIRNNEMIGIFADYDADGIPGASFFHRALIKLNARTETYIPNRESGYGLSREGIDHLVLRGCSLIITIDLGIKSIEEAKYCKEKNIDLIITDHHLPGDNIPEAVAVVNPLLIKSKYPFIGLSGAGVIFKVVCALQKKYPKFITNHFLKWNLDLIAISTIADVVPLTDENRVIAKYGLIVINKTKNIGLIELIKIAGLKQGELFAYHIAFQIAPRINAPGRVDFATKSYELLTTNDREKARELAQWLNDKNTERQEAMNQLIENASEKIEQHKLNQNHIISIVGNWAKGILGPSASQIAEKYSRPTIIFSGEKDMLSGSARSVEGVNIVDILDHLKKCLNRYGGHKGAAGLSIDRSKYREFEKKLIDYCNKNIDPNLLQKKIKIDCEVNQADLKLSLYDKVLQFEPFGMGNKKPVFVSRNAKIGSYRFVGNESKHLSLQLIIGGKQYKAIYFNFDGDRDIIKSNTICDIAFSLSDDTWNSDRKLSLNIIDCKILVK